MYVAYGHPALREVGITNLHIDISDAVNVMVHVSVPKDTRKENLLAESYSCLDREHVDSKMIHRIRGNKTVPGAIWHIYHANDANKIRDLLNKVAIENNKMIGENHDPIHDQSNFLDYNLRERLRKEYNVKGYTVVQCLGDAFFIPAGAPHQVRNLNCCINVAEDFVSPENVSNYMKLVKEFRTSLICM
jgi:lysine-specific demethylase 3